MSATDEEIVLADNWYEGLPSSKPNIVFEVKTAGGKATIRMTSRRKRDRAG